MSNATQGPITNLTPQPRVCTPAFNGLMDFLEDWREADHADNITLSRNQIVVLIEGVQALRDRIYPRCA